MKKEWLILGISSLLTLGAVAQEADTTGPIVTLKNSKQQLRFNLDNGIFEITNAQGEEIIRNAFFQMGGIQSKDPFVKRTCQATDICDELGKGKLLTINISVDKYADIVWQAAMYGENDYVVFNMGIKNDAQTPYRVMAFYPLISNHVYNGFDTSKNYQVLEGASGGARTLVLKDRALTSFNNLLAKFGTSDSTRTLVAGGITYNEFEKFVTVRQHENRLYLSLFSEDPVGKLVDAGEDYMPNERFYLCFNDKDPFHALEKYGKVLKLAQNIRLNKYDFPTECLWYASFYNNEKGRRKFNDSKGAVEEMDNAIRSGITRFTRTAIRLVPDAYGANNQQGWWDDEHWAMYGEGMSTEGPHYIAPYTTTKSWAGAILEKGGIPITYFQSGRRSDDYALAHPGHMLFNDPYRAINQTERFLQHVNAVDGYDTGYFNHWWTDKMLWSYDFTDPGFISHMKQVYANLREAGIKGIMYDYPEVTSYAFEGGFEDPYKTTAWAYRNMFKLAYDGLGPDAYLDERNLLRGSDITLGLVASQRVWADTDGITPEMVTRCGLRWYKNRTVVNYDMDSKDPGDALPLENNDGARSLFTMCYVTSGRFLLGRSFNQLTREQLYDMSRTFPYHTTDQSARPLDAFNERGELPRIYDFEINPSWHQLTFYNYNMDAKQAERNQISVQLSAPLNDGGMALPATDSYHVYDFWNNRYIGKLKGTETLSQTLREGEARMMAIHKTETHPQFISTNRHIMQGYIDMKECEWKDKQNILEGTSTVVADDPYKIIIATNGYKLHRCKANGAKAAIRVIDNENNLLELTLNSNKNQDVSWQVSFR